ncbi:hypothetical protein JK358_21740 [Nocardia sp. 2]|uniref:DUF2336 domain-containing protein n=1 Tax=Nocardia acididurans TaxID=2802282 RepID=A0ABS1M8Y5_9NOCA|nr:hypothetical protein [Nocardia acididurans]MBL1077024.1 hypothetical protein [Nocardia acididurans]
MTNLAARAEVIKLARELHTPAEDLAFLLDSDPAAIRRIRHGMHAALDARHRPMFDRLAKVSALVPNSLAVAIATRYYGPVLCGMIASSLSPERAVALIGHVPTDFLADVSVHVDPAAATPIVRAFDSDILVPVMRELLARKDYVTLARFLVAATDRQLLDVVPHIETGEDLLLVAFNAELDSVADRFEVVLADLSDDRIRDIVQAMHDRDRFAEGLTFMQFLTDKTLGRVADATAALGPEILTHLVESCHRENAWAELIPVATAMSADSLDRLLALDTWDEQKLTAVTRAAEAAGHTGELARLLGELEQRGR